MSESQTSKQQVLEAFDRLFAGKKRLREVAPQTLGCERYQLTVSGQTLGEFRELLERETNALVLDLLAYAENTGLVPKHLLDTASATAKVQTERAERAERMLAEANREIGRINDARLTWAMACHCECAACSTFYDVVRERDPIEGAMLDAACGKYAGETKADPLLLDVFRLLGRLGECFADDETEFADICEMRNRLARPAGLGQPPCPKCGCGVMSSTWRCTKCGTDIEPVSQVKTDAEHPDTRRLRWLSNTVLFCDYGDNSAKQIGWRVYEFIAPMMYGASINEAIDAAMPPNEQPPRRRSAPDVKGDA